MPGIAVAQAPVAVLPAAGSNWQHVQQLPLHTRVHISADSHGRMCTIAAVREDALVCVEGGHGGETFQRSEIRSVKLTRRGVSTLAGAGIGAGGGAVIAFAAIHEDKNGLLDFSGDARGIVVGVGVLAGAAVGWPTDFLRGPAVYVRP